MPMIVQEKDMAGALQLAARSPLQGIDPGFLGRFESDYAAMRDFSNSDAMSRHTSDVQGEFIQQLYEKGDLEARQWVGGGGATLIRQGNQKAQQWFEQWKGRNPSADLAFPTPETMEAEALRRMGGARQESNSLQARSNTMRSGVGGFLGTAAGAMTDPINIAATALGAVSGGLAGGILRTAMIEGGVNLASETAIQALTLGDKQKADPTFGAADALYEVGAAGVGGAVLGGGLKGLAAAWSRAKTGQWPSHVRDTGAVLTREATIPASRFEKTVAGDSAHRAAVMKAADDIQRGRPVELPPEAFTQANTRPGRVYDADGNNIGVRYEVVEADDLVTSHLDDLGVNPAFPPELQPRDRSRALSQDQIAGIAANLQPERLGFSAQAESGAPIVGADGLVESGNGRVMALRRAYQQNDVPASNYRSFLKAQNFDVDAMRNPVLIARRVTDLDPEARVGFVNAANRSTAMRLGASEQALADARLLDADLLGRLDGADVKASGNQAFARGFMSKLPRAEQGSLIDKDGFLSQEGERRITAALMGRAYGEPVLLGRALEDTDNNIKTIAGALADSSAPWSMMRDAVARGEIPAGMDITDDLLNAVKMVMRARDEGRPVGELVHQAEMFGGPDELAKIVARSLFSDADMKRPIGRAKMAAFLRDYASEAMKNDAGPRLFGDALGASDILKSSLDRVGRQDLMQVAEERLSPAAIDKLAEAPETVEASIMDGLRLVADNEEQVVAGKSEPIRIDIGDGRGERTLDEILNEADEEIAAAGEIEACTIGSAAE